MGLERKATDIIVDKIINVIEEYNKNRSYDKTFKSTIWSINNNGTYTVSYQGQEYCVTNAMGTPLSLGQGVWVKIPCGNLRYMHICGVYYKKERRV